MKVIYLHGFASGPASSKALFFRERLSARGVEVAIPDLADGDFENMTISNQLTVVDREAAGRPVTLIGSSMGGYVAALYAARHPEVEQLVLLAPAFCFARRWPALLGDDGMQRWRSTGRWTVFHYGDQRERELSYKLVEDGLAYEDFPDVPQKVLILHGTKDEVVPPILSEEFGRRRPATRRVLLIESGHELTDVTERLWSETAGFLGV